MKRVLLTGVSGFLGSHIALQLLQSGCAVRGSVRKLPRADGVRDALASAGADTTHLEFVALELLDDRGWAAAAAGCDYLIHVASPFVMTMPKDKDELIRPAIEGTRRAVTAALGSGHERIVLTSSLAAIDAGHRDYHRVLGPADWTQIDGPRVNAYIESKTLAEREAWRLVDNAGQHDRLAVINPGAMLGPLLDDDPGTSATVIQRMLKGEIPMAPDLIFPYVDVRDVARAHVAALTSPEAGGRRHLVANDSLALIEIAALLRAALPERGRKAPRWAMPSSFASLFSLFDRSLHDSRAYLGIRRRYDNSSGKQLLGATLIPTREAVLATANSLIERKLA